MDQRRDALRAGRRDALLSGLDHVLLTMPEGEEAAARAYFSGILGLEELPKPASLAGRGGVWFGLPDGCQLHLGIEEPFTANKKAHPAFVARALDEVAERLERAGHPVRWDHELAPRRRFFSEDPFGNRLELVEAA